MASASEIRAGADAAASANAGAPAGTEVRTGDIAAQAGGSGAQTVPAGMDRAGPADQPNLAVERTSSALREVAEAALADLKRNHRLRTPRVTTGMVGADVMVDGSRKLNFASNDYLGLAMHPAVIAAAIAGTDERGAGATAQHGR